MEMLIYRFDVEIMDQMPTFGSISIKTLNFAKMLYIFPREWNLRFEETNSSPSCLLVNFISDVRLPHLIIDGKVEW